MKFKICLLMLCAASPFLIVFDSQAVPDKVCYTYDELARISSADYQNNAKIDYQLDAHGNRTALENTASGSGACLTPTGNAGAGEPETGQSGNQSPIAMPDSISDVPENQTITIPVTPNDTDPDGDALIATFVSNGSRGSASVASGGTAITYDSGAGSQCHNLTDTLIYTVGDGQGGFAQGQVNITYAHADGYDFQTSAPTAQQDPVSLVIGGTGDQMSEIINILENDGPSNASLSLFSIGAPTPAGIIYVSGPPTALQIAVNPNVSIPMNGNVTATIDYVIEASYLNCQTQILETHPTRASAQIVVTVIREPDESSNGSGP